MNIPISLAVDIALLAFLLYHFVMGMRRGLILTACSLLSVFLGAAGGWFLSAYCSASLAQRLAPAFRQKLILLLAGSPGSGEDSLLYALGLPEQFVNAVLERTQTGSLDALAGSIAALAAAAALFLVGFILVILLWNVLCRTLDLVAKLPVLHAANRLLGGVIGLFQGSLMLFVAAWVACDLLGLVPADIIQESRILPYLSPVSVFQLLELGI